MASAMRSVLSRGYATASAVKVRIPDRISLGEGLAERIWLLGWGGGAANWSMREPRGGLQA